MPNFRVAPPPGTLFCPRHSRVHVRVRELARELVMPRGPRFELLSAKSLLIADLKIFRFDHSSILAFDFILVFIAGARCCVCRKCAGGGELF